MAVRVLPPPDFSELDFNTPANDMRLINAYLAGESFAMGVFRGWMHSVALHVLARLPLSSVHHLAIVDLASHELRAQWLARSHRGQRLTLTRYEELYAWLLIVLSRVAMDYMRDKAMPQMTPLAGLVAQLPAIDAALADLKAQHPQGFAAALQDALASLDVRLRNTLKFLYIGGLTAQAVGAIYGVQAKAVEGWDANARKTLAIQTKTNLDVRCR